MMNYKTYLFDFDYTLADSSRGIVTCFRNVLNRHQYTNVTDEAIKRTIGKTLEESFSTIRSHRLGTAHRFSTRVQTGSGCSHEREYPPFS